MLVFFLVNVYNIFMITCVLLSAGFSRRFGSPKALALLNGKTVLEHVETMLVETKIDEIIVVLGAHAEEIKPYLLKHTKLKFVYNKDYNLGQTSSFKAGLQNISKDAQGILLLPVDYPLVQKETIDHLIRHFWDHSPFIVVPAFDQKKGHPPLFSVRLKHEFLALDNECGLNVIAHAHEKETIILPVKDPGVIRTFNTPEEFQAIRNSL